MEESFQGTKKYHFMKDMVINMDFQGSSLVDKAFHLIERDILNGKYKEGEQLVEAKLCEALEVSRTPIREALRLLENEGLVKNIPNKGVIVVGISAQDISDIYTVRIAIEGLAAKWAAERITDEEIEELGEIIDFQEFYKNKSDIKKLSQLDSKFHDLIYDACRSRTLKNTLAAFRNYIMKARETSLLKDGRLEPSLKEHYDIFEALRAHNGEEAKRLTQIHIENARDNIVK